MCIKSNHNVVINSKPESAENIKQQPTGCFLEFYRVTIYIDIKSNQDQLASHPPASIRRHNSIQELSYNIIQKMVLPCRITQE